MGFITGSIDVKDKNSTEVIIDFDAVDEDNMFADGVKAGNDKMKLHIGGTNAVGDGELNDVIGGQFNINKRANDLEDLLDELLFQQGNKDDGEVGISGVEIVALTTDTVTITFDNGVAVDTMTLTGEYVTTVLASIASGPNDAGDQNSRFNILDAEDFTIIGTSGAFDDIVGNNANKNDTDAILKAALDPDDGRIELISLGDTEFSVRLVNGNKVDTFIFTNAESVIDSVIDELDGGNVDTTDGADQFVFIEQGETGSFGNAQGIDENGPDIGNNLNINNRANDIETLIENADEYNDVTVTETADLAIIGIDGRDGSLDTIYYELG